MGTSEVFSCLFDARIVEAIGLREAVQWVLVMGKANVVFEYDAKVVVDAIHAATVDLSEFSTVIAKCKSLLLQGRNYLVQFVRR